tara:strand:+ start:430 stop:609 length:180 start_codon:yes stop_codon:yes gene_type:complete
MPYPTNPIYKLHKDIHLGHISCIRHTVNGKEYSIPFDEANTDYQAYLEWAKTNTAEAAD